MLKRLGKLLKNIVLAFLLLYGLNYLVSALHVYIPINVFTVGITTFLGLPGLASLIILFFIVK